MATYCNKCSSVHRVNKNDPPYRWLCVKVKRPQPESFVCEGILEFPPYAFCRAVNQTGECEAYAEAPQEQWIKLKAEAPT